ncbi:MAG TPA: hypothetical protein VGG71_14585 [Chitinophagaceae bacterium]
MTIKLKELPNDEGLPAGRDCDPDRSGQAAAVDQSELLKLVSK